MTICSRTDKTFHFSVNITHITPKEETKIDKGEIITIKRDNIVYNIDPKSILCYGEIDFHTSSDDYRTIEDFDWLKHVNDSIAIPSKLNYDDSTVYCKNHNTSYAWYDTFNSAAIAQYLHCRIGKPKRTLIFLKKW